MGIKKIAKTATGIFTGSLAVDAFRAERKTDNTVGKLALKTAGSIAAATSFHILKEDAIDVIKIAKKEIKK